MLINNLFIMNFVEGKTTYNNINIDLDIEIEQCIAKIHNEMIEQVIQDGYTNIYWKYEGYHIVKIPGGIGYITLPERINDHCDYHGYIHNNGIREEIRKKIMPIDIFILLKLFRNSTEIEKHCNKLSLLLQRKAIEDNKKLHEKVDKLTGYLEDFMALFKDIGDLNGQKNEKQ